MHGIKWFHRNLLLSHGLLVASAPLTPVERRVLHLLLTDASEKAVAARLGLTHATVHQYVVSTYGPRLRRGYPPYDSDGLEQVRNA